MRSIRSLARLFAAALLASLLAACSGDNDPATGDRSPTAETASDPGAQQPSTVTALAPNTGQQVYEHYCIHCHAAGPGHPGTDMLAAIHGEEKAILKGREDLNEEYVKTIVRNGLLEMAPFRPTEISDAELDALAAYVVQP